jgi:F420-non-reducing hydrogenase iron-sulfur subunit
MNNKTATIYVFYCVNGYDQTQVMRNSNLHSNDMKLVPLPCTGKLDILYLVKAFETGADGAAVMMCKEGECRYLEGNMRARKRAEAVEGLLKETGIGEGRVAVIQMDDGGIGSTIRKLEDFCLRIASLPRRNQVKALQTQP